ncbi:MAG: hypothetical protein JWL87_485 [Candidatus Adlerbacteria bacterium]|nr:hypothetical protein [Candidatus Adlerbacteria bacterium]
MKRIPSLFLQVVVMLIGIGVLAFMLWEPHLEGRNAHATLFEIYFNDLFLAYAYTASIAFFIALYQAFKLLGLAGRNEVFSQSSLKALRTMKYCALALIGFVAAPLAYLLVVRPGDDIAGGVAISLLIIIASAITAAAASVLERILQKAVDIKSDSI